MKIVLMTPDLGGKSGWSRYALDLGRALHERGHELHCICSEKSSHNWCTEYPFLRQPTSYLGSTLLCLVDAWRVQRLLRRIKPDIVHSIAEPYALLFPFMRKHAWKEILTIHGTYSVVPLLMGKSTRRRAISYYRRMHHIIAVSNFTKQYLAKRIPELADIAHATTVIHNAISLAGIDADTAQRPKERTFSILSVSGIKRKKGYLQSLRAIRAFLDAHPCALTYDIVGNDQIDPAFTRELHSEIDALGLSHVVRIRGILSDVDLHTAYRQADLFLLPSLQEDDYFEGFGLVFIEANARGTPCIGGNTGGCPEAMNDGTSGYVCDPEHATDIAKCMQSILVEGTITRAACRMWADKHDINRAVMTIENVYTQSPQ